ncbi:nucleotidyl transferase AbiEii/AbiGii toxin family protein [Ruania rhizosphaerae]|uniref:nucleotidyl transferase AbiEii/AbiGii toxin family protein n=1 Tax=Ruania rhizosphaerae TaxID=1840413 RepID=UPI003B846A85
MDRPLGLVRWCGGRCRDDHRPGASDLRRCRSHSPPTPVAVTAHPVVDHIADKVAATESTYGGHPSGRVRDLVDLVVIAQTHQIDGTALHAAIESERRHRELPYREAFVAPAGWARTYPREARRTVLCADYSTFPPREAARLHTAPSRHDRGIDRPHMVQLHTDLASVTM